MGWQERQYAGDGGGGGFGRPGGDWRGMRPSFDNPFSWSIFLFRAAGIAVRVHWLFLAFIVVQLLRAIAGPDQDDFTAIDLRLTAIAMISLFVIVLAHEFGHCLACRWVGGAADEILMWPLGGLAFCDPPRVWRAHLITAAGGPAVNVAICIFAGLILGVITDQWMGVAFPNPFTLGGLYETEVSRSLAHQTLYLINAMSLILLLFNLLPIFPLDGGRILQAILWSGMGWSRSMRIAVYSGFVGAILLGMYALMVTDITLMMIALFGGFTCYTTLKQVQFSDEVSGFESDEYAMSVYQGGAAPPGSAPAKPTRAERRAQRAQQDAQREAAEVDRILEKIAHTGMDSLSRTERNLLKRATERKRQSP